VEIYPLPPGFDRNWMFREQMLHLLDILQKGVESRCTLQDGIIAQTLVMGALLSAQSKSIYQF
jgi:hypothetical protein